jgi:hypothetical protein
LTGVSAPEEGVDAKAGKTRAQDIATRSITRNFKFEGTARLGNSVETVGHKDASSFQDFWWAGNCFVVRPTDASNQQQAMYHVVFCE